MSEFTDEQGNLTLHPIQESGNLVEHRGDGTVWAKLPDGRFVEVIEKPEPRADGLHCATCQCNKLHLTPPMPGNPRSRSWHQNAGGAPKS